MHIASQTFAMHIKICGITTLEQAMAALAAGADMLGFNFYPPSPRAISPETCARIISGLHKAGQSSYTVGVFVNMPSPEIRAIQEACQLDGVQLSGDETPEQWRQIGDAAFKAVRPATLDEALAALESYGRATSPALLLDARIPQSYGGSGRLADWNIARELARRAPILLAGGLTPDNVGEAIRTVRPWGVDVASGVESAPGVKDPDRMAAFVRAVRRAASY